MARSRNKRRRNNAVSVTINVPYRYASRIPRRVSFRRAPRFLAPARTRRLSVAPMRGRKVRRRVRVVVPRRVPPSHKGYLMWRPGSLTIYNRRSTENALLSFDNRKRNKEVKRRRRRKSDGQAHALRRDRFGIIGDGLARNVGAKRLNDLAMVVRALGG